MARRKVPISELPAGHTATGDETIVAVQNGETRKFNLGTVIDDIAVSSVGGVNGAVTIGAGLEIAGNELKSTNPVVVSSLGEISGDIDVGAGLEIVGDTLQSTFSLGGSTAPTTLGSGLTIISNKLRLNEYIDVRDGGAAGTGLVNDSVAFNLAIAEQGIVATKPIFLPKGTYLLSTSTLNTIYGPVYGPDATIIAADGGNGHIFKLYYRDNGLEKSFQTFDVLAIQGYGYYNDGVQYVWPNQTGTAIYAIALDSSEIKVKELGGFSTLVWLDGGTNELHQGVNSFDFRYMHSAQTGILMNAGSDAPHQALQESNHFRIGYMQGFTSSCIYLGGGGTNDICDNVFDIVSMTPNHANADGIVCTNSAKRNEFNVRSWDAGVSGTGRIIRSTGSDNVFRVPYANFSTNIDSQGTDIWDMRSNCTDGTGRSDITSTGPPAAGSWRLGDITWNLTPSSGGPPGWMCVGAGVPGTWKAMANLA